MTTSSSTSLASTTSRPQWQRIGRPSDDGQKRRSRCARVRGSCTRTGENEKPRRSGARTLLERKFDEDACQLKVSTAAVLRQFLSRSMSPAITTPVPLRLLAIGFVPPCLPTKAQRPPSGPLWLHEIKHDGFRVIARKDGHRVRLYSRPGNDLTHRFPLIVEALTWLRSQSCIIDGEAVCCDDNGMPSFDRIRYRRHDASAFLYAIAQCSLHGRGRINIKENLQSQETVPLLDSTTFFGRILLGSIRHHRAHSAPAINDISCSVT